VASRPTLPIVALVRRRLPIALLAATTLTCAWDAAPATAQEAAAAAAASGGLAMDETAAAATGGNRYGTPFRIPATVRLFRATPRSSYVGAAGRLRFRVDAVNRRSVRVQVLVRGAGRTVRLELGPRRTNRAHTVRWARRGLGPGTYVLTLRALDAGGRPLARAARSAIRLRVRPRPRPAPPPGEPRPAPVAGRNGVFPIAGSYSWGEGFGVDRGDHLHRGQDLAAAAGTPLVSPRRGSVIAVGYQAAGAGNYVVIRDAAVDRSYVFMHLQSGSITLSEGQSVTAGQRIGRVGSTGRSTGPHLHFEVWVGGWWSGGHAIDPAPTLRSWAR
jgi:murein DD-endopeptidase MepM/ murein hydrolase activator NlpD